MKHILLLIFVTTTIYAQDSTKGTFIVKVAEVDKTLEGKVICKLYRGIENWLEDNKVVKVIEKEAAFDTVIFEFKDILYSKYYAVQVFHDEDSDNEIDFSLFPPGPSEGVGVSNNKLRMGPPKFEDAQFEFSKSGQAIIINMNY